MLGPFQPRERVTRLFLFILSDIALKKIDPDQSGRIRRHVQKPSNGRVVPEFVELKRITHFDYLHSPTSVSQRVYRRPSSKNYTAQSSWRRSSDHRAIPNFSRERCPRFKLARAAWLVGLSRPVRPQWPLGMRCSPAMVDFVLRVSSKSDHRQAFGSHIVRSRKNSARVLFADPARHRRSLRALRVSPRPWWRSQESLRHRPPFHRP